MPMVFLAGDVMTGRGIDQLLEHPSAPELHEPWIRDARAYVELAEARCGPLPRKVGPEYIWGDLHATLARDDPSLFVINLETSVTTADVPWPGKDVHYRMHPANVGCLRAGRVGLATLANNHVLDWGRAGLEETLEALHAAEIATAGAGRDVDEAEAPVAIPLDAHRRWVAVAVATESSGVPPAWAASAHRSGVALLSGLGPDEARAVAERVASARRPGDLGMVSIHWGSNWGHAVPEAHVAFAHALIERGVDVVHGHSSHHPRAVELHRGRPILYGAGDLIDDYEGIRGHEALCPELGVLHVLRLGDGTVSLSLIPFARERLRLRRACEEEVAWLAATLDEQSARLGTRIERLEDGTLRAAPAARARHRRHDRGGQASR
jgi:poly-gamma-glutamate capsule biosynthesis protein CapA/YwtB (metallophosphatase superfamily)